VLDVVVCGEKPCPVVDDTTQLAMQQGLSDEFVAGTQESLQAGGNWRKFQTGRN